MIRVTNNNLCKEGDHLHHFNLPDGQIGYDFFADVKFILCGGTSDRMEKLAHYVYAELNGILSQPAPRNISRSSRYVLFKIGPILCVSHGIAIPSMSIMLNEIIKTLYYAGATDVTLIRCGTSGGIGVEPGELVVSTEGVNGELKSEYVQYALGERRVTPSKYDQKLASDLVSAARDLGLKCSAGKTLAADGFYEEQARQNGIFCDYTADDAARFVRRLHDIGVRNIEMEATCLSSVCARTNIRGGAICVALINRLDADVIRWTPQELEDLEARPGRVATEYIRRQLVANEKK